MVFFLQRLTLTRKIKTYSSSKKIMIPYGNMEIQERMKTLGKDNDMGKYKLLLTL
jgi:hypothetical protein